jgi:hypothetical protein
MEILACDRLTMRKLDATSTQCHLNVDATYSTDGNTTSIGEANPQSQE